MCKLAAFTANKGVLGRASIVSGEIIIFSQRNPPRIVCVLQEARIKDAALETNGEASQPVGYRPEAGLSYTHN